MEDSSIGSNIRETISENKGKLIFLLVCIILSIVIGMFTKSSDSNEVMKKDDLETATKELAGKYYEEVLYKYIKENSDDYLYYLESREEKGIEITLRTLVSGIEDIKTDIFNNEKYTCNFVSSTITYYPKGEYSSSEYDTKINLNCEDIVAEGGNK